MPVNAPPLCGAPYTLDEREAIFHDPEAMPRLLRTTFAKRAIPDQINHEELIERIVDALNGHTVICALGVKNIGLLVISLAVVFTECLGRPFGISTIGDEIIDGPGLRFIVEIMKMVGITSRKGTHYASSTIRDLYRKNRGLIQEMSTTKKTI